MVRNIIEEQGEVPASQPQHLLKAHLETDHLSVVAVADVQSGTERVNEPEAALLTDTDHFAKRERLLGRVKLAPDRPML